MLSLKSRFHCLPGLPFVPVGKTKWDGHKADQMRMTPALLGDLSTGQAGVFSVLKLNGETGLIQPGVLEGRRCYSRQLWSIDPTWGAWNWPEKFSRIHTLFIGIVKLYIWPFQGIRRRVPKWGARRLIAKIQFSSDQPYDLGKHINIL